MARDGLMIRGDLRWCTFHEAYEPRRDFPGKQRGSWCRRAFAENRRRLRYGDLGHPPIRDEWRQFVGVRAPKKIRSLMYRSD